MKNKHIKLFEEYSQDELDILGHHDKVNKDWQEYDNRDSEEDGMMNDEEIKEEVLSIIKDYRSRTNQWAVRDTLKYFTGYGFWSGDEMTSIDIETANKIASELYEYVESFRAGHPNIEEVYDELYKR